MPEGPEIRRAADRIERAIAGRPARGVEFAFAHLKRFERRLEGRCVESVETRGKAMLVHFEGDLSVYTHSQLYGRWYVVQAGRTPRTRRTLRFAVRNEDKSALLYSASEIEVLTPRGIQRHAFLAKLGPDILSPGLGEEDVEARVADPRFARRRLHALLLDQGFVAGLGNYLRSEILFVAGLHPMLRPMDLSPTEQHRLAATILRVTRQAYRTGGITNDRARVKALKAAGMKRSAYRHHVFTRGGQGCWTCEAEIERLVLGGRKIFRCPECQPEA